MRNVVISIFLAMGALFVTGYHFPMPDPGGVLMPVPYVDRH